MTERCEAVAADDEAIGRSGAALIHGRMVDAIPHLGRHDIVIPAVCCWINERVAAAKGISINPEALAEAIDGNRIIR